MTNGNQTCYIRVHKLEAVFAAKEYHFENYIRETPQAEGKTKFEAQTQMTYRGRNIWLIKTLMDIQRDSRAFILSGRLDGNFFNRFKLIDVV